MHGIIRLAAFALVLLGVAGPARASTLYDDLGGKPGLTAIVGDMVDRAVADPRIKDKLDNINLTRLKSRIAEQFCTLTGGPCHFKGISMKGAHAYLHLHDTHFNALVEDLQAAMDKAGIPFFTQNRLLALLAPMHKDIVNP
jgi:hemoglobin